MRPAGRALSILAICSIVTLAGCPNTPDETYRRYVERLLAAGPAAACCPDGSDTQQSADAAAKCRSAAARDCAFVVGAKIEKLYLDRFGDDTGATVSALIAGPNGRANCHYQMYRDGRIGYGGCRPEGAPLP
jgi:hypothetical protein